MIEHYLKERKTLVEERLESLMLPADGPFSDHIAAMRYSLFAGGKRIRPILCLAAGEAISSDSDRLDEILTVGCAIECIHTYSLIHDDLPAMDDDELRRGKPTNHMKFGEAGAILAGDGLLSFAFQLLSTPGSLLTAHERLTICNLIARAAGPEGMVGGQALDIAGENGTYPFEHLKIIHRSKTGALIQAAVTAGAIGGGADRRQLADLGQYGESIGLAFQIVDDLLDVTSTTEALGKSAGSDEIRGKATYPAYFGVEKTAELARDAVEQAKTSLTGFGDTATPLRALADYILQRTF